MHFDEIASRLTGLSCPVFGVSWSPPEPERAVARRILTFLEDRRVLYVDSEMEIPSHCVDSILRIRELLTTEIGRLTGDGELVSSLRALRAACRKFLDTVNDGDPEIIRFGGSPGHYASWTFNGALGGLRGVFGVHAARLAAAYGIDVEDQLASIFPEADIV
jgi:hypothetical protein